MFGQNHLIFVQWKNIWARNFSPTPPPQTKLVSYAYGSKNFILPCKEKEKGDKSYTSRCTRLSPIITSKTISLVANTILV